MSQVLSNLFEQLFGKGDSSLRLFFAPGRINLIGEHTDYTGGYVFPAALSSGTWALVRSRQDRIFHFFSTSFQEVIECHVDDVVYRKEDGWTNYPKGVMKEFLKKGVPLSGADILYDGNNPQGAGLSSSASVEMVTAVAMNELNQAGFSIEELVKICRQAENQFVGVNCGIMDQFAVGMGKAEHAILLNCQTLEYAYAPLQLGEYRLVITNTNKQRGLADSKYNERRREVETGFAFIAPHVPDVTCLGQVTIEQWEQVRHTIQDETIARRLEHVVKENARVIESSQALATGDLTTFGQLMNQSHHSLCHLYKVTGPELDSLVKYAQQVDGCIGSRMTGAGFGGCTVSLVHQDQIEIFKQLVRSGYEQEIGLSPTFYVAEIGEGARELVQGDPRWRY